MEITKIIEQIKNTPSGKIEKTILLSDKDYKMNFEWKKFIKISIRPNDSLIRETNFSEIKKLPFISIILRAPQYSLRGEKNELTEKLLLNQYTRALLYFRASRIFCQKNQISYSAQLKKKDSHQLQTIIEYLKELIVNLK